MIAAKERKDSKADPQWPLCSLVAEPIFKEKCI